MGYSIEDKKNLLAKCLNVQEDNISVFGRYFELDDGSEYLVLDEDEREDKNLYYFETLSDLAQYEIEEGLYSHLGLCDIFWGDAPNPLNFIDLTKLGEAWFDDCDDNYYHRFSDDSAIFTNCGWGDE